MKRLTFVLIERRAPADFEHGIVYADKMTNSAHLNNVINYDWRTVQSLANCHWPHSYA